MLSNLQKRVAWAIRTIASDSNLDKGINDIELSKILGTNHNTLAAYRKEKGLLKGEVIENLVSRYNFSPQWLLKGEGEPFPGARAKYEGICGPEEQSPATVPAAQESVASYHTQNGLPSDFSIADDIRLAIEVLESKTHYATSLHMNIRSFSDAVKGSSGQDAVMSRILSLEDKVRVLQNKNDALKEENKSLRSDPDQERRIADLERKIEYLTTALQGSSAGASSGEDPSKS